MVSEPFRHDLATSVTSKLFELAGSVAETWERERHSTRQPAALNSYVEKTLRTIQLVIAGLEQSGADLDLLRQDFEAAALPLEYFLRGLDAEPALQRTA